MSEALFVDVEGRHFKLADGRQLQAVGQLNFTLPANSFTCIVGPSGCGKTTTLRMILGLDVGYEGRVSIPGEGRVAAVFQEPRLLPWRTVEQNIRLVLPLERADESLDELLEVLGLAEMRTFYPGQLSLGLARRASLARAFILQPDLLILDEPFVSLDESTAVRLRSLLIDLWQSRPTTALMVTHNESEAIMLADQIIVFSERPAHILGTVSITTPRTHRSKQTIVDTCLQLAQLRNKV